jgi:hypothetical protein
LRTVRGHPTDVLGVGTFAPRAAVWGPLVADRVALFQGLQYRHAVTEDRARPQSETGRDEYLTSVTRLDFRANQTHALRLELAASPGRESAADLGAFVPLSSTFDRRTGAWRASLADQASLSPATVLESVVSVSRDNLDLSGHGDGTYEVGTAGASGRYFNTQQHTTRALQWTESLARAIDGPLGGHVVKIGTDLRISGLDGSSVSAAVLARRADGEISERITYPVDETQQSVRGTDVGAFAQDHWRAGGRLEIDLGVRLDHDGVFRSTNLGPRVGAAWRTAAVTLSAGVGMCAVRTPLTAGAFAQIEGAWVTRYGEDGSGVASFPQLHALAPGLRAARGFAWDVAADREQGAFAVHVGYLERRDRDEAIVVPTTDALVLTSAGHSGYREAELRLAWTPRPGDQIAISYVRSAARANTNPWDRYTSTVRDPFVAAEQLAPAPTDVPDRVTARLRHSWGADRWLLGIQLEWRTGFPYSALDAYQTVVGLAYGAGRFPDVTLVDLVCDRRIHIGRFRPWLGLRVHNALDVLDPHAVQQRVDATDFGSFYDPTPRRMGIVLRFAH